MDSATTGAGLDVITGAFGYIGRYIARLLLERGRAVRTLTGHPKRRNPFGAALDVAPLDFDHPDGLAASLRGAATLYNTYWVRFQRGPTTFARAVENTRVLVRAAQQAQVQRLIHISITNPAADSPLPYFRGKALVEELIATSGISYAILRPTVVFGREDILINNIAWLLRRWPVFAIPGAGDYRLQPVFVEDLARLAVSAGEQSANQVLDAVGPEVFRFDELVGRIAQAVGSRARLIRVPPGVALTVSRGIGWLVHDVVLTSDELKGLIDELLISHGPPTVGGPTSGRSDRPEVGPPLITSFTRWLTEHAEHLGRHYASELRRHF
jgi:uncharacterized protein YbjT (DUF2867 family)